jgi:HK97 gp10 family phage protein
MLSSSALKGADKLTAQLGSLENLNLAEAESDGAQVIVDYMQTITPVDTGELRDSESVVVLGDKVSIVAAAGHASYVEFGTYKMRAQPYMRPAIDTQQKAALKAIAANLNGQIRQKARSA